MIFLIGLSPSMAHTARRNHSKVTTLNKSGSKRWMLRTATLMGMAIGAHCSNEVFRSVRSGNYESKSWGMGLSNGIKNLASKDTNERIDWGSQLRPMSHGKTMMNAMQLIAYKFQSENREKFRCNQVA